MPDTSQSTSMITRLHLPILHDSPFKLNTDSKYGNIIAMYSNSNNNINDEIEVEDEDNLLLLELTCQLQGSLVPVAHARYQSISFYDYDLDPEKEHNGY